MIFGNKVVAMLGRIGIAFSFYIAGKLAASNPDLTVKNFAIIFVVGFIGFIILDSYVKQQITGYIQYLYDSGALSMAKKEDKK